MRLGIMQPYIFPYIGYFQLINAVDKFVIYDDVTFIKQGWINRNRILLNGEPHMFTVPLRNASSFVTIAGTEINKEIYTGWCSKFMKTLTQAYNKAPNYREGYSLVEHVLSSGQDTISGLAAASIATVCDYLGITTTIKPTATGYGNNELKAQDRIIDICRKEDATTYINATGGRELYDRDTFANSGIQLSFIRSGEVVYPQFDKPFVPWLSVIDVIMFNTADTSRQYLQAYTLE